MAITNLLCKRGWIKVTLCPVACPEPTKSMMDQAGMIGVPWARAQLDQGEVARSEEVSEVWSSTSICPCAR